MRTGQVKSLVMRAVRSSVGSAKADGMLLARNMRYQKKHDIIFIHIPKNAGSAVSQALYGRSLGHKRAQDIRTFAPEFFDQNFSFAVLRDPILRAFSAWRYCRTQGTDQGWVKNRPEYHLPSFQSFDSFAQDWLPAQDKATVDLVFQTQSSFVQSPDKETLVSKLVTLPNLTTEWPKLINNRPVHSSELSFKNKNKSVPSTDLDFSQKTRQCIEAYYAQDMELYKACNADG